MTQHTFPTVETMTPQDAATALPAEREYLAALLAGDYDNRLSGSVLDNKIRAAQAVVEILTEKAKAATRIYRFVGWADNGDGTRSIFEIIEIDPSNPNHYSKTEAVKELRYCGASKIDVMRGWA